MIALHEDSSTTMKRHPWRVRSDEIMATARACPLIGDEELIRVLRQGPTIWNKWWAQRTVDRAVTERPNLYEADLKGLDLAGINLSGANLQGANLDGANLSEANLQDADLTLATLKGTVLKTAYMLQATVMWANLTSADLREAYLACANFCGANLTHCDISDSFVWGISAWDINLTGARQMNLLVTGSGPEITTDNLEVAQFIYLLLNNQKVRHVIDTITSKVVLILGRFTPERKAVLDAIQDELRKRDYLPVLFDFEKPSSRDITETVSTLAHMAQFVIADITDARGIPQELMAIVPTLPSVPVQPLLLASQREYGMFEHFKRYPWVLEPYLYEDQDRLLAAITDKVIGPAEKKAKEQTGK